MKHLLATTILVAFGTLSAKAQDTTKVDFKPYDMDRAEAMDRIDRRYSWKSNFAGASRTGENMATVRMSALDEFGKTLELTIFDTGNGPEGNQGDGIFGNAGDRIYTASYNPRSGKPHSKVTLNILFGEEMDVYARDKSQGKDSYWIKGREKFRKNYTRRSSLAEIRRTFGVAL